MYASVFLVLCFLTVLITASMVLLLSCFQNISCFPSLVLLSLTFTAVSCFILTGKKRELIVSAM